MRSKNSMGHLSSSRILNVTLRLYGRRLLAPGKEAGDVAVAGNVTEAEVPRGVDICVVLCHKRV